MPSRLRLLIIGLFLAVFPPYGRAATAAPDTDSLLTAYYHYCKGRIKTPEGPALCDTLRMRAAASGNVRIEVIARCLKLDHYYYADDRAQILDHVKQVQAFCVAHGKEHYRYFYYFVWGSRLITYYVKQNEYSLAVYECRRMLAEAQADDYAQGIADCYRLLGNIYISQNAFRPAYDNFRRGLEQLERHGIDDINIPTQYASLAQCALELDMPDSALVALRRAETQPRMSTYQRFTVAKGWALYHIYRKDLAAARLRLEEIERLFRDDPSMEVYTRGLGFIRREYYKAAGDYPRALRYAEEALDEFGDFGVLRDMGDIYYRMGDTRRSAENYRAYVRQSDSVRNSEVRNATDDFSGLLEIGRLQSETRELQLEMQRKRLRNTYLVILSLACVLLLGGLSLARLMKLNRRLKSSEERVRSQNEELKTAGEELLRAKEEAERASSMKSGFIQNMSHEVRTPLNSIVGFSQVLSSLYRDDPATQEYARIIETSSINLLRLIDDVLDIAFLDQADMLPATDFCELNSCCRECADKIAGSIKKGVALIVEPSDDNPQLFTNARRIRQVLLHLLHNAAKFTLQGQITLSYDCLMEEGLARFTVTDTGPGIPPEKREEVFERFVKLDAFSQGTGLGLPVCRIIACKLGGRLEIDPLYTAGCRFVFEVPFDRSTCAPTSRTGS
ncbi:ATP-binding protein [Alistipes sp.]|uniref:ATP-binding protein n=1 Tax=Alistipes sp. TaxID=1872444 RepID=UPI003AEFE9FB